MGILDFFSKKNGFQKLEKGSPLYSHILREFQDDPNKNLQDIQSRYGLDGATQYFYFRLTKSHRLKVYRGLMADRGADFSNSNQDIQVLIIPPPSIFMGKGDRAVVQGMKQLSLAAGFGKVEVFQPEMSSVLDGALKLKKKFIDYERRGKRVLLFSFSYGSAAVRFAMDQIEKKNLRPLLGWVNLSGLIYGSPQFHCSNASWRSWNRRAKLLRSYSCEQRYFLQPLSEDVPPMISFLGCQSSAQMAPSTLKLVNDLRHWGPNDGLVPFVDYEKAPGFVVPLWGHGHHIRLESESRLLQKSLCYLVDLAKSQRSSDWALPKMGFQGLGKNSQVPKELSEGHVSLGSPGLGVTK